MTSLHGSPALPRRSGFLAALLMLVIGVPIAPGVAAQDATPLPAPSASVGSVVFGGTLAEDEGRDPEGEPSLVLASSADRLIITGARNGFRPEETAAFRLALPAPAAATALTVHMLDVGTDGVETLLGTGSWTFDPAWDTATGFIPAPPEGQHELRVYRGSELLTSAPIATWDVPRVVGAVTDPLGVLADAQDQVSAALGRFADATEGQLWLVVVDSTGDTGAADYAERLWSVNEDHMWPVDALAVLATSNADLAVRVGSDLGFYVTPDEVDGVVSAAEQPVIEGRFADAVDVISDELVSAFDSPPPAPGATPTPRPSPTPETVRTPVFLGLTRAEAQVRAEAQDLRLRTLFEQTTDAPAGIVIAQEPLPGRPVEILGRVTITVAQAPAMVSVPDVTGETEEDAVNALLDSGLQPGARTTRTSASIEPGSTISTNPRAGVVVQPGSTIDYVVSRGPAASPRPTPRPTATPSVVTVPDVRGIPEEDALTELGSVGLRAGTRARAFHSSIEPGDVIRTDPTAGVRVSTGTRVDYVVSRGPRPSPSPTPRPTATPRPTPTDVPQVTVPDVRGMSEADALTELGSAGLRAGTRTRAFHSSIDTGDVIRTDPAAGERVDRNTEVDYVVSRGPEPTPSPTPRPTERPTPRPTPRPTATPEPTAEPTQAPTGDLLERIQARGRLIVNIDPNDGPWSRVAADGSAQGYDVDVATRLADQLGVDIEFTTFPFEEVVTGGWGSRFDIAMHHIAITDSRRSVLDFSAPYAFDSSVIIVPAAAAIGSLDDLTDAAICAARGSDAEQWLTGTLQLTDPPVEPASPPDGVTLLGTTTDSTCVDEVVEGAQVVAGLVGVDDADRAIADGDAIQVLGDPVYHAPIGIAYDRSGPDSGSLQAALGDALESLRADGILSERSIARFDGRDVSQVPGGGSIESPSSGDAPAFAVDDTLAARFPGAIGDIVLAPLFLNGADLDLLLRPSNTSVSRTYRGFADLGAGTDLGLAALGLAMAPVVDGDDSAMLTAAHLEGTSSTDLEAALTPLFGNQLRTDHQEADVELGGKPVTRSSSGAYEPGDTALWVFTRDGVAWFVLGTEPLAEDILAALPD